VSTGYCYVTSCKITVAVHLLITFCTICSRSRPKVKADTTELQRPISKQFHYFAMDIAAYTHLPTHALFSLWLVFDRIHKCTIHSLFRSVVLLSSWDLPTACCVVVHMTCDALLVCCVCSSAVTRNLSSSEHKCREIAQFLS